jgi:hypothetical protein
MRRLVIAAALAVAVLTGCGGTTFGSASCTPPAPTIEPRRTHDRILVEYQVDRSRGCEPWAIHITAHSVDKLDNIAPGKGSGGPIPLKDDDGVVELKLPPLDLPPYEALGSTVMKNGRRSETVTVRVPETGNYCRRTRSAAVCIRRAQAKFMRCLRGNAPRAACPDYVWNARPLIPYVPLRGVTRQRLERSFALTGRRGGSYFVSVRCASTRWCVGTWRAYWGTLRARYEVSAWEQRDGCWIAERRAILEDAPPPQHVAPLRHVISDRQHGCVFWVR